MKIKSICSIQGTAVENEDALGSFGNFFWVIDGATDLYHAKKSIGYLSKRSPWAIGTNTSPILSIKLVN